ncbi:ABC transporter ATP-binding protein [Corynebacterium sp. H78]|uniref:ABC transporter ATP-binding protein n=1 Tax=Corynebacterium sp. H78 TaxID=3133417 RepID=UPI00309B90EC
MNAISFKNVRKSFGKHVVLNDLSFEVPVGSIFGFLGPNGSGKTTSIRVLMGLGHADSGSVSILGSPAGSIEARRNLGYLSDVPAFDPWLSPAEYLTYVGQLSNLRGRDVRQRVHDAVELARLEEVHRPIGALSRGMRQRLGIAQAVLATPSVIVLDEPTSALDPIARAEVLDFIGRLRGHATVFFSTHSMADVEAVCDNAAFLGHGRAIAQGTIDELTQRYGSNPRNQFVATFRTDSPDSIPEILTAAGCSDVVVHPQPSSLGDAFANALGDKR